ncbi:MAG: glycosyl transferase [Cytophagales bacterium]|nr:MAG: glycosyl transferase [Cytophagales bacterium]
MKILYAIQGTGNGHLSRAIEIVPILKKYSTTHTLISGTQADLEIPFEVNYRFKGLGFIFGKSGGVDLVNTYKKNNIKRFLTEVKSLDLSEYDLVINDFEPISAWAAYRQKIACIGLSHQSAVISSKAPKPKILDPMGLLVLKTYAPVADRYGFHFEKYDNNIFTPVVRNEIRMLKPKIGNHYTVYLPSYDDEKIIKVLSELEDIKWEVFSKHNHQKKIVGNIIISPINSDAFIKSMVNSIGILCGAGFETPAEALYLQKKLMVIPMKNQFEQQCNAAALKKMGIPVIKSLKKKYVPDIQQWVLNKQKIQVDFPDETENIVCAILKKYWKD